MAKDKKGSIPVLGCVWQLLAIPCNFVIGFLTGVASPVAAIAGMVVIVRLVTGKVPFLSQVLDAEDGEQRLSLDLVQPERATERFQEHKERIADDLGGLQAEIKAVVEETKAKAQGVAAEDSE